MARDAETKCMFCFAGRTMEGWIRAIGAQATKSRVSEPSALNVLSGWGCSRTMVLAISIVLASAGKSISNASSASVTSLAVPKTVTVFRNDTVPRRVASKWCCQSLRSLEATSRLGMGRNRVGRYFRMQPLNDRIGPRLDLLPKDAQRVRAPFHEVHDSWTHSGRMQDETHGVDRRSQEIRRTAFVELWKRRIR